MTGETPLIHASRQGHFLTAKYLLEQGADPSASSELGATALHHAAGIGLVPFHEQSLDIKSVWGYFSMVFIHVHAELSILSHLMFMKGTSVEAMVLVYRRNKSLLLSIGI